MLEKDIQRKVCEYARERGCLAYKFVSPARASVPDCMFITPPGFVWFCEFKAPGKKATPAQEREHARLRAQGMWVYVIDSVVDGREMVDVMVGV